MRASSVRVLSEARADHVTRLAASDRWRELLARLSLDASEHVSLVLARRLVAPARARRPRVDPAEAPPLLTSVRHVSLLFVMRVRAGWVHPSARRRARASRLLLRVMASDLCGAGERHPQLYLGPSSGSPTWRPVAPVMPVAAASHPVPPPSDSPCGPFGRSLLRSVANAPPGSRGHRRGCRAVPTAGRGGYPSASPPGAERGR